MYYMHNTSSIISVCTYIYIYIELFLVAFLVNEFHSYLYFSSETPPQSLSEVTCHVECYCLLHPCSQCRTRYWATCKAQLP